MLRLEIENSPDRIRTGVHSSVGTDLNTNLTFYSCLMEKSKSPIIILAAILSALSGIFTIVASLLLIFTAEILSETLNSSNEILAQIGSPLFTIIGFFLLIWGALDLVAAYGLWNLKKYGGIIVFLSGVTGLILTILITQLDIFSLLINVTLIVLVALRWHQLE